jgi:hypothetical protein
MCLEVSCVHLKIVMRPGDLWHSVTFYSQQSQARSICLESVTLCLPLDLGISQVIIIRHLIQKSFPSSLYSFLLIASLLSILSLPAQFPDSFSKVCSYLWPGTSYGHCPWEFSHCCSCYTSRAGRPSR